ncbi:type-1 angiotensin II receptor-like [Actinia tenebrosa]|uniref:Type-1 angiotensin II receptor-like n=1 Tax=Actinia tenebrosa TaxID=6105 RepID=A0A6P8IU12_ACTTE|nr:type-1 angiotensin II receptor-like [Actinia tenebrosa]
MIDVSCNCSAVISNSTNTSPKLPPEYLSVIKKVCYFIIAILALFGNTLVSLFFCQKRKTLLKKSYYIILLALAITDIVTAFFLFITPAFLFIDSFPEPTNRTALWIYCKVLWGRLLLFIFGVASVYLILLLTIDRWYAVMKPTKYKTYITKTKVIRGIVLSYFLGALFIIPSHPNIKIIPENPSGQRCSFDRTPHLQVTVTINFFTKALFPFIAIAVMYSNILYKMKSSSLFQQHMKEPRKHITKIAFGASLTILICWLPNQINLLLYAYGMSSVETSFHDFTVGLVFMTSCINPILYGLTSKKFRKGYWETLKSFKRMFQPFFKLSTSLRTQIEPALGSDVVREPGERHRAVECSLTRVCKIQSDEQIDAKT